MADCEEMAASGGRFHLQNFYVRQFAAIYEPCELSNFDLAISKLLPPASLLPLVGLWIERPDAPYVVLAYHLLPIILLWASAWLYAFRAG
jgi:hypothetical protein